MSTPLIRLKLKQRIDTLRAAGVDISATITTGRVRVFSGDGTRELAPTLPAVEMAAWIHGFETAHKITLSGRAIYLRHKALTGDQ